MNFYVKNGTLTKYETLTSAQIEPGVLYRCTSGEDGKTVDYFLDGSKITNGADLAAAVSRITTVESAISALTEGDSSVDTLIESAITTLKNDVIGAVPSGRTVMGIIGTVASDTTVMGEVAALQSAVTTLNGDGEGSVEKQVADAIAAVVASAPSDFDTLKEISDWISGHSSSAADMNSQISANASAISANASAISANASSISALESLVGELPVGASASTVVDYIGEAITDAAYDDTALASRVSANESAITTLNADVNTAGSVKKQIADAIGGVVASAPSDYDTLKKIADWISAHTSTAEGMASDISANASAISANTSSISALESLVGTLPAGASASTVTGYVDEAVTNAFPEISAADEGKVLMANGSGSWIASAPTALEWGTF